MVSVLVIQGVFGWNDFEEDEKKGEKQEGKWMRVVFGWGGGGGGEKIGGAALFSMGPPKLYHPKIGEKTQGKTSHSFSDKP